MSLGTAPYVWATGHVRLGGGDLLKLVPYAALAIYPIAYIFGFSFNPTEFSWTFHHGFEPMPAEVRERAAKTRRFASFLGDTLVVGLIVFLLLKTSIQPTRVGLHLDDWKRNVIAGIVTGILIVLVQGWMAAFTPADPEHPFTYAARRGSVLLWVSILLGGAFSEELWIVFCLVVLMTSGYSTFVSVVMTLAVFAAVHYLYRFGVIAVFLKGAISAILFLWSGSLIPSFLYHFIGNLGSLYLARRIAEPGQARAHTAPHGV